MDIFDASTAFAEEGMTPRCCRVRERYLIRIILRLRRLLAFYRFLRSRHHFALDARR